MTTAIYKTELTDTEKEWLRAQRDANPAYKYMSLNSMYKHLADKNSLPRKYSNNQRNREMGYNPGSLGSEENLYGLARAVDNIGDFLPDWDWVQAGYERSLTGQARKLATGESKFFDEYEEGAPELNAIEDIAATALSFIMPLDMLTMGMGTKSGSLLTKGTKWNKELGYKRIPGLGSYWQKKANQKITAAGVEGLSTGKSMALGAIEGAFPLAYYEGAINYTQAKINNQNPEYEYTDPILALTKGVMHGGALGAVTGGVTRGIMSKKQALLNKAKGPVTKETLRKLPLRDWPSELKKRMTSGAGFYGAVGTAPGTIGIESLIFSGVETLENIGNMEDPRLVNVLKHFGTSFAGNLGLFGALRAQKIAMKLPMQTLDSIKKAAIRRYGKKVENDVIENVKENIKDGTIEENSTRFNEILKELDKQNAPNSKNAKHIQKTAQELRKDLQYVADSIAKGEKHLNQDAAAISLLANLGTRIGHLKSEIKKTGANDQMTSQLLKELETSESYWDGINKRMNDGMKEIMDTAGERDAILSELATRDVESVVIGGKPVSIYSVNASTKALKEKLKMEKDVAAEKAGIINQGKLKKLDEKLELSDVDSWLKGISRETGDVVVSQPILARRKQLSPLLKSEAPKSIKGKNAEGKYLESTKIIDYLIQTHYPEFVPAKGATRIKIDTAKKQVGHLKEFAKYLAKKGKTFENATADNIRTYLQEPGTTRSSHDSVINRLIITMNKLKIGTKSLRQTDDKQVKSWTKKIIEDVEVEAGKGMRPEQFDVKKNIILKPTSKKGVFKEVPISIRTSQLSKKNEKKYKIPANEGSFRNVDGKEIYGNEALHGLYEKIIKPLNKKKVQPARQIRDMMKDFFAGQKMKDKQTGIEIEINKFVNDVAMGQNTLKQLDAMYGIKKGRAQSIYKEILKKFNTAIKGHIEGNKPLNKKMFDVKEESRFSFYEVINGLKDIVNGKGFKNDKITFEERKWDSKQQKRVNTGVKHTISKDMAEFMVRSMLEVPSRLNEVIRVKPTKAEQTALETKDITGERLASMNRIEKNIESETKNLSPFEKTKILVEKEKQLNEIKERKKSFKKSAEYKARLKENGEARVLERELESLRGKRAVEDVKMEMLGSVKYTIGKEVDGINSGNLNLYKKQLKNIVDLAKNPKNFEKQLQEKGLNSEQIKNLSKGLGEPSGDVTKLTLKSRNKIKEMLKDYNFVKPHEFTSPTDMFPNDKYDLGGIHKRMGPTIGKFFGKSNYAKKIMHTMNSFSKHRMAAHVRISELGYYTTGAAKKHVRTIEDVTSRLDMEFNRVRGENSIFYNTALKELKKGSAILRKETSWLNRDKMEKVIIPIHEGKIKVKDKGIKDAIDKEYFLNIQAYKNSKKEGTIENLAYEIIKSGLDANWNAPNRFRANVLKANKSLKKSNPEEYKRLVERLDELTIPAGEYGPQYVTKEAKNAIRDKSPEYIEALEAATTKIIKKTAYENTKDLSRFKKKVTGKTKEQNMNLKGFKDAYKKELKKIKSNSEALLKAKGEAKSSFDNAIFSSELNYKSKELYDRTNAMLPYTRNAEGKVIPTYEKGFSTVYGSYFQASARFNAIASVIPEYLHKDFYRVKGDNNLKNAMNSLGGARDSEGNIKTRGMLKSKDMKEFNYLEKIVNEMIGKEGTQSNWFWNNNANIASVSGLSGFVEPGLKNALLGQVQIWATHGTGDYLRALSILTNRTKWNEAKEKAVKTSAVDYIVREFGEGRKEYLKSFTEKVFNFSGMTKAENFNRIIAIEASKISGQHFMQVLSGKHYSNADKNEAARWLKEVTRFTKKELEMIETGQYLKKENQKMYDHLVNKLEVFGHKATQGGVDALDVPLWMNQKFYKPLLVFQRIATSVTGNINRNIVKPALMHGNFAPLLRYTVGSYFGGLASYAVKDLFFGIDDPKSLGSNLDKAMLYLWKAEFAGMYSYLLDLGGTGYNPFNPESPSFEGAMKNMQPAVVSMYLNALKETWSAVKNEKFTTQAIDDALSRQIVLYSQFDRFKDTRIKQNSAQYRLHRNVQNYVKQYEKEKGTWKGGFDRKPSIYQAYYRELKDAIRFGSKEDIAREYYNAFNYLVTDFETNDPYLAREARIKQAHKNISASLNHMNPVSLSEEAKSRQFAKKTAFYNWLRKQKGAVQAVKDAKKAENQYQKSRRTIDAIIQNNYYRLKYSAYPY